MELTTVGIRQYYGPNTREYYGSITANCGQRIGFGLEEHSFWFLFSNFGAILVDFPRISHIYQVFSQYTALFKRPGITVLYGIFEITVVWS